MKKKILFNVLGQINKKKACQLYEGKNRNGTN